MIVGGRCPICPDFYACDLSGGCLKPEGRIRSQLIASIATLCDWLNPEFDTPGSHEDWHHGSPCPYAEVIPAYLRGEPDPRRNKPVMAAVPDPNWYGEFWAINHRWPTDEEVSESGRAAGIE